MTADVIVTSEIIVLSHSPLPRRARKMNEQPLVISSGNDEETQGNQPSTPDHETPHTPDTGTASPCDPSSAEETHLIELDTDGDSRSQQPEDPHSEDNSPLSHFVTDGAFRDWDGIKPSRRRNRKRRELESQFGKSSLYFVLRDRGLLGIYLDRDLANRAGINPRDRVEFYRGTKAADRFALAKGMSGWQIKELSRDSDLLYMSPTIATPYRRVFHSFVFDADVSATPTEVEIGEARCKTCISFTLPNILPPSDLQARPLVLTRAFRDTILNLDQSLAAEAGIGPGNPLKFGYDAGQYPEKLLIFRRSDQVLGNDSVFVKDRWLHNRWDLDDFNTRLFPKGSIHLTPSVQVGGYTLSPERPSIKVLVVTVDPPERCSWGDIGRCLFKPFYHGSLVVEETKPLNAHEEKTTAGSDDLSAPISLGGDAGGESHSDPDNGLIKTFEGGSEELITIPFESSES